MPDSLCADPCSMGEPVVSATPGAEDGVRGAIIEVIEQYMDCDYGTEAGEQDVEQFTNDILAALRAAGHLRTPGTVEVKPNLVRACALIVEMVSDNCGDESVAELAYEAMHYIREGGDYTGDDDALDTVLSELRAATEEYADDE